MGHGGAERVVSILSNAFAQRGHEVVLTTQWESQREYPVDARVRRIHVGLAPQDDSKGRFTKIWLRYARLRKCIQVQKPDLVISFCNKANFRSAFAMLGMKVPLLVSVRNDPQKDYAPYMIPTWYMERKASGCVFQTPDAMHFFSDKFQKKSCIIFNPLADSFLKAATSGFSSAVRKREIVTAGRISRQKNQLLLLRAFHAVLKKNPDFNDLILRIYGEVQEKDYYDELQRYIEQNSLEDKIHFMGLTDVLAEKIREASVFILSSDYEGMPNALIEAMVVGLPCIATDCPCGGAALLIQDGISGRLVPTGQVEPLQRALEEIFLYPEKSERMGRNARNVLEKVHPDRICEEWMRYISEIVET